MWGGGHALWGGGGLVCVGGGVDNWELYRFNGTVEAKDAV